MCAYVCAQNLKGLHLIFIFFLFFSCVFELLESEIDCLYNHNLKIKLLKRELI